MAVKIRPNIEVSAAHFVEKPTESWMISLHKFAFQNKVGLLELNPVIFNAALRKDILALNVNYDRRNKWQGTAKTKTRAEVRGGGR